MPVLSSSSLLNTLVDRNAGSPAANATNALQVVCAWPVSGQYGTGSRVLYADSSAYKRIDILGAEPTDTSPLFLLGTMSS